MNRLLRVFDTLLVLALSGLLLVAVLLMGEYTMNAADYRFGSEVAGWAHRSANHYVATTAAQALLAALGLAAGFLVRSSGIRRVARTSAFALSAMIAIFL